MKISEKLSISLSFNNQEAVEIQELWQAVQKIKNVRQKDVFRLGLESILADEELKNTVEK